MKRRLIAATTLLLGLGLGLTMFNRAGRGPDGPIVHSYSPAQGGPTLSINDVSLVEGNTGTTAMVFTVTLTASGARQPISVGFDTADGPPSTGATAPSDYTSRAREVLFFPAGTGNTTMTISVT